MVVWARLRLAELGEDRAVGVARRPGFDDDGGGPRAVQDGKGGQQPAQRRSAVGVGGTGGHRLSLSPLVRVVPVQTFNIVYVYAGTDSWRWQILYSSTYGRRQSLNLYSWHMNRPTRTEISRRFQK